MSSPQLTFLFFRGVAKNHQPDKLSWLKGWVDWRWLSASPVDHFRIFFSELFLRWAVSEVQIFSMRLVRAHGFPEFPGFKSHRMLRWKKLSPPQVCCTLSVLGPRSRERLCFGSVEQVIENDVPLKARGWSFKSPTDHSKPLWLMEDCPYWIGHQSGLLSHRLFLRPQVMLESGKFDGIICDLGSGFTLVGCE